MTTALDPRRQAVLEFIVGDYIRTAAPVASQQLARLHRLRVSPATIRNDMAGLEELGFISRPHPSAGAVPADRAYRFYVERVQARARPSRVVQELVHSAIHSTEPDADGWARAAAAVLSRTVHNVAITITPRVFQARMLRLQLVQLQDRQALLIVVMQEARLRQHLVPMEDLVTQEHLNDLATQINTVLAGKTAQEMKQAWNPNHSPGILANQIVNEALRLMEIEEQAEDVRPHLEGLGQMLGQPEFLKGSHAQRAVEVLQDQQLIGYILPAEGEQGEVYVTIGEEHHNERLQAFSVVLAQYGIPGTVTGVVCTIGPTRMDYALAIASVGYVSRFLSDLHATLNESSG